MNEAIGGLRLRATVAMVLLAALLLMAALVFAVRPAATTGASSPGVHAKGTGGSDFTEDPYIARHAEVVEYFRQHNAR